jgi:DNA-binding NarL/FixJ family response regulator
LVVVDEPAEPVRVLVADDDPRVRTALRRFLSASPGFHVVGVAGTAATAVEMAREQTPHVALVDLLLPEADDGLGVLRTMSGELAIPAIAISIEGGLRTSALAAGACRFLDKDSPPELLVTALRQAASPQRQPQHP